MQPPAATDQLLDCLPVCLPACFLVCLSGCLSTCPPVPLLTCLLNYLLPCLPAYVPTCRPAHLSACSPPQSLKVSIGANSIGHKNSLPSIPSCDKGIGKNRKNHTLTNMQIQRHADIQEGRHTRTHTHTKKKYRYP